MNGLEKNLKTGKVYPAYLYRTGSYYSPAVSDFPDGIFSGDKLL